MDKRNESELASEQIDTNGIKTVEEIAKMQIRSVEKVKKMQVNGLCLFEKDVDVCLARIGIDLGILSPPSFASPEDTANVSFKWGEKFDRWDVEQVLNTLLFAMMTIHQRKEDAPIISTVAIARLLAYIKYMYELASGSTEDMGEAMTKPSKEVMQAIQKRLDEQ